MIKASGNPRRLELTINDKPIALLRAREMGFALEGKSFTITRQGLLAPIYQLWLGEELLASTAQAPLLNRYTVTCQGKEWELRWIGFTQTKFALFQAGERAGSISTSWWNRYKEVLVDLPADLPLELPTFLMWLIFWKWGDTSD